MYCPHGFKQNEEGCQVCECNGDGESCTIYHCIYDENAEGSIGPINLGIRGVLIESGLIVRDGDVARVFNGSKTATNRFVCLRKLRNDHHVSRDGPNQLQHAKRGLAMHMQVVYKNWKAKTSKRMKNPTHGQNCFFVKNKQPRKAQAHRVVAQLVQKEIHFAHRRDRHFAGFHPVQNSS